MNGKDILALGLGATLLFETWGIMLLDTRVKVLKATISAMELTAMASDLNCRLKIIMEKLK